VKLDGTAREGTGSEESDVDWSLLLKVFHRAQNPDARVNQPTSCAYWCREPHIYRSGLLADLQGDLRAPRCAGVTATDDGSLQLWLEFVWDDAPGDWTFEQHARFAQHLGAMNGASSIERFPSFRR
jgi:hypothetical protein